MKRRITKAFIKILMGLTIHLFFGYYTLNAQPWAAHGNILVIPQNPHYLQYTDGTPFFWLGDTGWEMLHRLDRQGIVEYLFDRSEKGYNVIQTVLISEFIHSYKVTNFYNDSIFINENPGKPFVTSGNDPVNAVEYDYWDHVDFAVEMARKMGLYLALLPTWGEWVTPRVGEALFNTPQQAYNYGWFLGNRYKNVPNIIWMLGGDRLPDERDIGIALWRAMAEGITDGVTGEKEQDSKADYSATLMTWHSYQSSSNWFSNDEWIDLNTWGSYHGEINNPRSYEAALKDWNLSNPKPTLNSEPCYEKGSINYGLDDNGYFTSADVRIAAYWSVFSGAAGITYGANGIWQFAIKGDDNIASSRSSDWKEALNMKGCIHLTYLKKLMLSRPLKGFVPDSSMLVSGQGDRASHVAVLASQSSAFIYIPTGNKIRVKLGKLSGEKIRASWFNPRTGEYTYIGEFENTGEKDFEVPAISEKLAWLRTGRGCDWVLVLTSDV